MKNILDNNIVKVIYKILVPISILVWYFTGNEILCIILIILLIPIVIIGIIAALYLLIYEFIDNW
jgi:hypothetical protein